MTTALYRRYRPDTFQEVVGQEHVTEPLMAALRADRITHAYLFSGPRGCGKTTSARILARCLNCAQGPTDTPCGTCDSCVELARGGSGSLDVVEIDAASHNGVDDARELRERASYAPVRDRFKVFILDEAHMVTPQGFNALLKLVEEPPAHVKFVFATTEPEKVIGTIRSRTHHYPFRLVGPRVLTSYLGDIAASEGVEVAEGVLPMVVRAGGGSVRDSLSVLDQLVAGSSGSGLQLDRAAALLGFTDAALLDSVVDALIDRDGAALFGVVDDVVASGHDPRRFVEDLLERLRDLVVVSVAGEAAEAALRGVPQDQLARMQQQAHRMGPARLSRAADLTNAALSDMTGATSPRLHLELLCARILLPGVGDAESGILARVESVEQALASGVAPRSAPDAGARPAQPAGGREEAPAPTATPGSDARAEAARAAGGVGTAHRESAAAPSRPVDEPVPDWRAVLSAPGSSSSGFASASQPAPASDDSSVPTPAPASQPATAASSASAAPSASESPASEGSSSGETVPARATPPAAAAPQPEEAPSQVPETSPDLEVNPATGPSSPAEHTEPPSPADPAEAARTIAAESGGAAAQVEDVPQQSAPSGGIDPAVVQQRWSEVVEVLAGLRRASWTLVSMNAIVGDVTAEGVRLDFPSAGLAEAFRNGGHAEPLEEALHRTFGVRLRARAAVAGAAPTGGGSPAQQGGARARSPRPDRPGGRAAGPADDEPRDTGSPGQSQAAATTTAPAPAPAQTPVPATAPVREQASAGPASPVPAQDQAPAAAPPSPPAAAPSSPPAAAPVGPDGWPEVAVPGGRRAAEAPPAPVVASPDDDEDLTDLPGPDAPADDPWAPPAGPRAAASEAVDESSVVGPDETDRARDRTGDTYGDEPPPDPEDQSAPDDADEAGAPVVLPGQRPLDGGPAEEQPAHRPRVNPEDDTPSPDDEDAENSGLAGVELLVSVFGARVLERRSPGADAPPGT